jgi:hypothetical protein
MVGWTRSRKWKSFWGYHDKTSLESIGTIASCNTGRKLQQVVHLEIPCVVKWKKR